MMERKLPVGIREFEKIRTENFLYVDKTALVYQLVHYNVPYFLSRPSGFGKSLLLSTMKTYWEGKKELFSGLAIEKLEEKEAEPWLLHPVFYFDFHGEDYKATGALERKLDFQLQEWEKEYSCCKEQLTLGARFQNLLKVAKEKEKRRCVVLVDEYDKPLLDIAEDQVLREHNETVLKGFFSVLKCCDELIQFSFITGITKNASIFSHLNQYDISLNKTYSELCGITEKEIDNYFSKEVSDIAKQRGLSSQECRAALKKQYDGYHFHPNGPSVYNAFSLLKCFCEREFGFYWFDNGMPTFLQQRVNASQLNFREFLDRLIYADDSMLKGGMGHSLDFIPLLYQMGYLSISNYDIRRRRYTLGFPNEEVKHGFMKASMSTYPPKTR